MHGAGVFFIVLLVLIVVGYGGWVFWSRQRASKLGLPPPSLNPVAAFRNRNNGGGNFPTPRSGGLVGWVNDKISAFKNKRHATGAYEESSAPRGGRLDPDEAWDSRVGNEAYYEEQELGLHQQPTAYGGGGYGGQPTPYERELDSQRGRSRTRELDDRYNEEMGAPKNPFGDHASERSANPFGDTAERSDIGLRGVSPRPMEGDGNAHKKGDSPTERRSMFREDV